jgi:hypothetical protein
MASNSALPWAISNFTPQALKKTLPRARSAPLSGPDGAKLLNLVEKNQKKENHGDQWTNMSLKYVWEIHTSKNRVQLSFRL